MISFNDAMAEGLRRINREIDSEVQERAMRKVAKVSSVVIRREMRAAGVQRSSETGSGDRRSVSEKQKVAGEGSILDVDSKIESYDERDIAFAGHALHKGAYRARFQGDGTEVHYLWDSTKTITMADSPNHTGKHYMQNAAATIRSEAQSIIASALRSALRNTRPVRVRDN